MSLFSLLHKSRQSPSRKRAQGREELGEIPGNNGWQSQSRTGQCGNHAKPFLNHSGKKNFLLQLPLDKTAIEP